MVKQCGSKLKQGIEEAASRALRTIMKKKAIFLLVMDPNLQGGGEGNCCGNSWRGKNSAGQNRIKMDL